MNFYSTNKQAAVVDFKEATVRGQAPDKGLYFPSQIPVLPPEFIASLKDLSNEEIAFTIIKPYVDGCISDEQLMQIVEETINFEIPLKQVSERIYSLELYHGPTLAFKDIGARFMSRCLATFIEKNKKITVLVATSGDTGGAVANGFYNVDGVEVVILYPSGKVSAVQEQQLTTLGGNVSALEVKGSFDDCQRMVKAAFADEELTKRSCLTSANSINVARWLPQQFYYFFAMKQWPHEEVPVISVPSGNFGNICAGLLAKSSGLPAKQFIAACNANDVIPRYLAGEEMELRSAVATISNAMDVGDPSNFIRILEMFKHDKPEVVANVAAESISDEATLQCIKEVYEHHNYLLDPHGAIGYLALDHWLEKHPGDKGIFLETAHPVKFPEAVQVATGEEVMMPSQLKELMGKKKQSTLIAPLYEELKDYLLERR